MGVFPGAVGALGGCPELGAKDQINTRILHSGSKAQYTRRDLKIISNF